MFVERYHPVCPVFPASPNSFRWWNPKISQVFAGKSVKSHSDTTGYPLVIQQFSTEDHHVNREFIEKKNRAMAKCFCLSQAKRLHAIFLYLTVTIW